MATQRLIEENYETYLEFLRELVTFRADFQKPENVMQCIEYCKSVFEENLPSYNVYFDSENNVIALPQIINPQEDILYFSAHVDTVGADEQQWDPPFHPWKLYEDDKTLVARGVNDCKAGVAYQLFLSKLLKEGLLRTKNTVFTITFKEEGAGKKTSAEIGAQMDKQLPLSTQSTYLIVLENTVSIADRATLSVYLGERSSYAISIEGSISDLQAILRKLDHWNPVSIEPTVATPKSSGSTITQQSGHVCSVPRESNKITTVLLEAEPNTVVRAGERDNFAVVPSQIQISQSETPVRHRLVLSNRSFDTLDDIHTQLQELKYTEEKELHVSTGFNKEEEFSSNRIAHACKNCEKNADVHIEYTHNIGASDATIILRSMDEEKRSAMLPIVMGPGSRSQRNANPPRLTHGKNETFDKRGGLSSISYISAVLEEMDFLSS